MSCMTRSTPCRSCKPNAHCPREPWGLRCHEKRIMCSKHTFFVALTLVVACTYWAQTLRRCNEYRHRRMRLDRPGRFELPPLGDGKSDGRWCDATQSRPRYEQPGYRRPGPFPLAIYKPAHQNAETSLRLNARAVNRRRLAVRSQPTKLLSRPNWMH